MKSIPAAAISMRPVPPAIEPKSIVPQPAQPPPYSSGFSGLSGLSGSMGLSGFSGSSSDTVIDTLHVKPRYSIDTNLSYECSVPVVRSFIALVSVISSEV